MFRKLEDIPECIGNINGVDHKANINVQITTHPKLRADVVKMIESGEVTTISLDKQYHIHKITGYGDVFDVWITNDKGEEEQFGEWFFEDIDDKKQSEKIDENQDLCKIGDTLYRVKTTKSGERDIISVRIVHIYHYPHCVYTDNFGHSYFNRNIGRTIFKTQDEAYMSLLRKDNIQEKKQLLKEYEKELNKKFNLEDHFFIK